MDEQRFDPETGEVRTSDECQNCAQLLQERVQAERDLHAAEIELRKLRRAVKALNTELRNQQQKQREYGVAEALGRYWILRCGKDPKRTLLGEKRIKKVMARLKEGRTPYYIARAIDGLAEHHYVNENTGMHYNDLELVCRDETMVEKYYDLAEATDSPTRVSRYWLKEFGVSDSFADVRDKLEDLAEIERQGKEGAVPQYDDTNRGVLFKNDKGGNDKRPDYRGEINVEGTDYELAAWIRKSQTGMPYMSLSVQPKKDNGGRSGTNTQQASQSQLPDDDDIPF